MFLRGFQIHHSILRKMNGVLSSNWSQGLLIGDVYVFAHFWDLSSYFAQNEWGAVEQLESGPSHWGRLCFCALLSFILLLCAFGALVDFSFCYAHLAHFQRHPSIMRFWALFSVIHSILRFCTLFSPIFLTCAKWASLSGNWSLESGPSYWLRLCFCADSRTGCPFLRKNIDVANKKACLAQSGG
jgi:hypothetical protein